MISERHHRNRSKPKPCGDSCCAPELLEALRNTKQALWSCQFIADPLSRKMICELVADADAVIAKATARGVIRVDTQPFVAAWNELCGDLPRVTKLTPGRRRKLELRIAAGLTMEDWRSCVDLCSRTPFLLGGGAQRFVASFDWLINNDDRLQKVRDRVYGDPRPAPPRPPTQAEREQAEVDKQREFDDTMAALSRKLDAGDPVADRLRDKILYWRDEYQKRCGKDAN